MTVDDFSWWQSFHFISLIAIIVFMMLGRSPALSVFYATVLAFALSFLTRETALTPKRLVRALSDGSTSVLTAAITCATAGIIVGVVTLTGLGQKFADIVISYAGGSLLLTAMFTALVVWIIGLAVPVTASYIICAVIAAPAMIKLDVPPVAAHMFIFYYSVLSEVSPPTALSPFAAAAITGGDPYRRRCRRGSTRCRRSWCRSCSCSIRRASACCSRFPRTDRRIDIVLITLKTGLGLAALASAAQGWAIRKTTGAERLLLLLAGLLMVFPGLLEALMEAIIGRDISYTATFGILIAAAVLIKQWVLPAPWTQKRPADVSAARRSGHRIAREVHALM